MLLVSRHAIPFSLICKEREPIKLNTISKIQYLYTNLQLRSRAKLILLFFIFPQTSDKTSASPL